MNFEDYFLEPKQKTGQPINVEAVEKKYNATYMGDFCVKTKHGWSEQPIAIFWQVKPPVEGYSHYFGLFTRDDKIMITDGSTAFSEPMSGIVANSGEVIYSRYRHDFHYSADGSVAVDGGRDYMRCLGNIYNPRVHIVADGPTLKIVPAPEIQPRVIPGSGEGNDGVSVD
jgi:hypothetical protein